jgi:membrane protein implicated in regulation of membrane protease activity
MPILLLVFVGLLAVVVISAAIVYVLAFFNINLAHYPWEVLAALLLFILIVLFVYLGKERLRAQRGLVTDARSIKREDDRRIPGRRPMGRK